ncbi:MAG: hypothetical protein KDK48_02725 [Chlamydiia bacterium]|nr:hypothetical protein [Chlamydiia bacterium]
MQSLGPNYQTGQYKGLEGMAQAKQEMMSAYKETFVKCKEQGVENVQMTLLSTGVYAPNDGNAAEWQQMSRECLQEAASEALADPNSSIKNITVVDYASEPKMQGINA